MATQKNTDVTETQAQQEATALLMTAKSITATRGPLSIQTEEEYQEAGAALREIQSRIKTVEERRKEWVDPLNKTVKSINGFFKPVVSEWEILVGDLKRAMSDYQSRKQEEARKALEAAAQIAAEGNALGATPEAQQYQALVAVGSAPPPKVDGISTRENWKFRITNEALVPREFLSVDERKVAAAVRLTKGGTQIPGIEVYREDTVVVRTA